MQLGALGGPVDQATDMNPRISAAAKAHIRAELGLDRPILVQYGGLGEADRPLEFRHLVSRSSASVIDKILERLPATLLLNSLSLGLTLLFALPLGFYSAVRAGSWFDKSLTVFVFIGFSLPSYALALMLIADLRPAPRLAQATCRGFRSLGWEHLPLWQRATDMARHLILPVFVLSIASLAGLSRYARNAEAQWLEVIHQDYIRTAVAKGADALAPCVRCACRAQRAPADRDAARTDAGLI